MRKRGSYKQSWLWDPIFGVALVGCAGNPTTDDHEVAGLLAAEPSAARISDETDHDFGLVLAGGQTLGHTFHLTNRSGRAWALVASAETPCCSSIRKLAKRLPAGDSADFEVEFRPGSQSGFRRVRFLLAADDPKVGTRAFVLTANPVAEVEVRPDEASEASSLLGVPGRQDWRVVCRRLRDGGARRRRRCPSRRSGATASRKQSVASSSTSPPRRASARIGPRCGSVGPGAENGSSP